MDGSSSTRAGFSRDPVDLWEAIDLVRRINGELAGYYLALTGSTLFEGKGKDVDVLVYPRREEDYDMQEVRAQLKDAGLKRICGPSTVWEHWEREKGSTDSKVVEVWRSEEGIKVDVFFPYERSHEWLAR